MVEAQGGGGGRARLYGHPEGYGFSAVLVMNRVFFEEETTFHHYRKDN